MARASDSRGFTLVELLVVITIIGVLVALLLPAVQAAREAARQTQCANNLKQIGLAAVHFESVYRRFPPGYLGGYGGMDGPQMTGCLAFLLPYLELKPIADRLDSDRATTTDHVSLFDVDQYGDPFWSEKRPNAWAVGQCRIDRFVCPSDQPYTRPRILAWDVVVYGSFKPSVEGFMWGHWIDWEGAPGRTNYLGSLGFWADYPYHGVFLNRSKTTFRDITDGASHTLLFGEATGGEHDSFAWLGSDIMCTTYGLGDHLQPPDWGYEPVDPSAQFSSNHPQVVQFCFADGSVLGITRTINYRTFKYLGAICDGQYVRFP